MNPLTFDSLVTPAGIVIAGTIVNRLVDLAKKMPIIDARISGAMMSLLASVALYIATAIVLSPLDPNMALNIFMSWLAVAGVSVGVDSTLNHYEEQKLDKVLTNAGFPDPI